MATKAGIQGIRGQFHLASCAQPFTEGVGSETGVYTRSPFCRVSSLRQASGELCFPGIAGGRLSNAVRRLFKRLGFEGLSLHSLRHTMRLGWSSSGSTYSRSVSYSATGR
jgi:hypothetical protein